MALPLEEIKQLIMQGIPDATIEIKDLAGDNNHYSAIIKSKLLVKLVGPVGYREDLEFAVLQ